MDLPWNEDKLLEIPSNNQVALNVLNCVVPVDTRVVLCWMLTNDIKTKNVFVKNRLKDILEEIDKLRERGIYMKFKYVNTKDNPADLITRGMSLDEFETHFLFWLYGPSWLVCEALQWPV